MDIKTLATYTDQATDYSTEWLAQPEPLDIYQLIQKHFIAGGTTIDVGCGNGRDTHWLQQNGFPASGYDASEALLEIARKNFAGISFHKSLLPALTEIQTTFANVYCETVIMHLTNDEIVKSVERLKTLVRPDGILYLSWRVTEGEDARDSKGRLYSAFPRNLVLDRFAPSQVLHFEEKISASSGKRVCRLIAKL